MQKVWLAIHAWYHPNSETDGYKQSVIRCLESAKIDFGVIRGRPIPHGTISQAFLPLLLRNLVSYGKFEGIIHDLYGDSVFRGAKVATIHDMYWNSPQHGTVNRLLQLQQSAYQSYGRTLRLVRRIVVDTLFTKKEIVRHYGDKFNDKIRVIPIACAPENIGKRHQPIYDVLWVGSGLKRKGPLIFVESISKLPQSYKIAILIHPSAKIVSDDITEIHNLITAYRRENRQIDVYEGHLSLENIESLYRSSRCLVSTSNYEGFHMPVAEAYLRGTNVVLPNIEIYNLQYGKEEGIHWYNDLSNLPFSIVKAVEFGNFSPSEEIVRRLSIANVGALLRKTYEEVD